MTGNQTRVAMVYTRPAKHAYRHGFVLFLLLSSQMLEMQSGGLCYQVYLGDADWAGDAGEDPLGDVICMECGQGDDEDNLMLCDGSCVTS